MRDQAQRVGSGGVRIEVEAPRVCPECGSDGVARIVYGLPRFDDELYDQMIRGRIVLGGMKPPAQAPVWMCVDCEAGWKGSCAAKQFGTRGEG